MHYLYEVRKGSEPIRSPLRFVLFSIFFLSLVAGPIKRYTQSLPALEEGCYQPDRDGFADGLRRIGLGLVKKVIIAALARRHTHRRPSSTKNGKRERDPEMHQTKKGNQWHFGLKAHIGADRDSKLVHTVVVTAANVADITQTAALLHGAES